VTENEAGSAADIAQFTPDEVPELDGWVLMADLASSLKISRQGLHQRMFGTRPWARASEMRRLGSGTRLLYLVSEEAADRIRAARQVLEDSRTASSDA
jgi:hypothetical protein